MSGRPCFNCGETGHLAAQCKKPKAKAAHAVETTPSNAQGVPARQYGLMITNGDEHPRERGKKLAPASTHVVPAHVPQPSVPTLGCAAAVRNQVRQGERKKLMASGRVGRAVKFFNNGACNGGKCNDGACNRSNHMYNDIDMERMGFWDVLVDGDRSSSGICRKPMGRAISEALDSQKEYNGGSAEVDVQMEGNGKCAELESVVDKAGDQHIVLGGDAVDGLDGGNCREISIDEAIYTVLPSSSDTVRTHVSAADRWLAHLQKGVRATKDRQPSKSALKPTSKSTPPDVSARRVVGEDCSYSKAELAIDSKIDRVLSDATEGRFRLARPPTDAIDSKIDRVLSDATEGRSRLARPPIDIEEGRSRLARPPTDIAVDRGESLSNDHSGVVAEEICGPQCDNACASGSVCANGLDTVESINDPRHMFLGNERGAKVETSADDSSCVHKKRISIAERRADKSRSAAVGDSVVESDLDRMMALRGYEAFYRLPPGSATLMQVTKSSAGIPGCCQFAHVMDAVSVDAKADEDCLNRQLAQQTFLEDLGVVDEVMQQRQAKQVRFDEPMSRGLHIFEVHDPIVEGESAVLSNETWEDVEFEVALDSGSQDHVCDTVDCPGYKTEASPGSNRGQCFVVGDGNRLPNMGQSALNLQPLNDDTVQLKSCFQIARVTRPLMSVGKICDNGMKVEFDDKMAIVRDPHGAQVCVFERQPGGLYLAKFRLKSPGSGFPRLG